LVLALLVVTVFGFSFVPIKIGLRELPPFALCAFRFVLASLPLVFFVRAPRMPWPYVVGYGFAIGVVQFGLLFLGIRLGMPAGLASLVIQVQVFFTIGLGFALLHERVAAHNLFGAAIAAGGIALLALHGPGDASSASLTGFALVIAAALAWAAGNIIAKRAAGEHEPDMFALVVWSSLVPPIPLAILSWLFEGGPAVVTATRNAGALTWACALFMAWGATLFGFGSWARLLHRYPTALIMPFGLLIPISGLISGALLLGESLTLMEGAGAALVLAGLAVNIFGGRFAARPV
jgi:O-acetylserine/cysteine efflux transporter